MQSMEQEHSQETFPETFLYQKDPFSVIIGQIKSCSTNLLIYTIINLIQTSKEMKEVVIYGLMLHYPKFVDIETWIKDQRKEMMLECFEKHPLTVDMMHYLSKHASLDSIFRHPKLPWDGPSLQRRPDACDIMKTLEGIIWDWDFSKSLWYDDLERILEHFSDCVTSVGWVKLSRIANLEFVLSHPEYKWDYDMCLSQNNHADRIRLVLKHKSTLSESFLNIFTLRTPLHIIFSYSDFPWNWGLLDGIDVFWDTSDVKLSACIRVLNTKGVFVNIFNVSTLVNNAKDIFENPDLPWPWKRIVESDIVDSIARVRIMVENGVIFDQDMKKTITRSRLIPLTDIFRNPELPWDYDFIDRGLCHRPTDYQAQDFARWLNDNPGKLTTYQLKLVSPYIPDLVKVEYYQCNWDWSGVHYSTSMNLYLGNLFKHGVKFSDPFMQKASVGCPIELITGNPHCGWDWSWVFLNRNYSELEELIEANLPMKENTRNRMMQIASHDANLDFVDSHSELNWDFGLISHQVESLYEVDSHPNIKWVWEFLSRNEKVISSYAFAKHKPWHYTSTNLLDFVVKAGLIGDCVARNLNPNVWAYISSICSEKDLYDFPDAPWSTFVLFRNENISDVYIFRHRKQPGWGFNRCASSVLLKRKKLVYWIPTYAWNFRGLSKVPAIEFELEFVKHFIDRDWDFQSLSQFVPSSFACKYPNKDWDWNKFTLPPEVHMTYNKNYSAKIVNMDVLKKLWG